mmetsp:Transcript_7463/g.11234  ORF Transcript_7463/g.11234 Transcript_7463/m.11234 type:complete len:224 (-) Transcript_7463:314-985(-)
MHSVVAVRVALPAVAWGHGVKPKQRLSVGVVTLVVSDCAAGAVLRDREADRVVQEEGEVPAGAGAVADQVREGHQRQEGLARGQLPHRHRVPLHHPQRPPHEGPLQHVVAQLVEVVAAGPVAVVAQEGQQVPGLQVPLPVHLPRVRPLKLLHDRAPQQAHAQHADERGPLGLRPLQLLQQQEGRQPPLLVPLEDHVEVLLQEAALRLHQPLGLPPQDELHRHL